MTLFERFADRIIERTTGRPADFVIGSDENPYMLRWWLTPWSRLYRHAPPGSKSLWQRFVTALPGIYLHHIARSDDDRALHDHPWPNVSVLLRNSYVEHTIAAGSPCHAEVLLNLANGRIKAARAMFAEHVAAVQEMRAR